MNISGYGVAGAISGYETQYVSQTSSEPFTIPILDKDTANSKDFTYSDYDPFKDMSETGNVELPGYIHTKTKPTRSDEEILKEVEELAKEYAKTEKSNNYDEKFSKLMGEYISSVSPDREGILKKSVNEICGTLGTNSQDYIMSAAFQQVDSQRSHKMDEEEKETELLDYLLKGLKNEKNNDSLQTAEIKGDMYYGAVKDGKIQYVDFFDPNSKSEDGENRSGRPKSIMAYQGGTLAQQLTKEEWTRKQEVYASYNAAYDVAIGK